MLACYEGVREAGQRGIGKVILETDSLLLKQSLADYTYRLAPAGGAIYELKRLIAVGRSCHFESVLAWDSAPSCIVDLVASDIAEL